MLFVLADSQGDFEFLPMYYPEVPNQVLFVMLLPNSNFYISVDDYDSGFFYEFSFDASDPIAIHPIPDAFDTPVRCFLSM